MDMRLQNVVEEKIDVVKKKYNFDFDLKSFAYLTRGLYSQKIGRSGIFF